MSKAYYSTVFDQPADEVWTAIREFDNYAWAGTGLDATMEDGKPGDAVGGIRRVAPPGASILRQHLLAHSDLDRSYSYELCDPHPYPVKNFVATLRVTPVTDQERAFVEWWATFDCAPDEADHWVDYFEHDGFATWLTSLRTQLESGQPV